MVDAKSKRQEENILVGARLVSQIFFIILSHNDS